MLPLLSHLSPLDVPSCFEKSLRCHLGMDCAPPGSFHFLIFSVVVDVTVTPPNLHARKADLVSLSFIISQANQCLSS